MKPPRYVLLETNYGTYTTYGVALVGCSDEYPIILETVSDLSTDKERVRNFALLCTKLELSIRQLDEAVQDFLTEQKKPDMDFENTPPPLVKFNFRDRSKTISGFFIANIDFQLQISAAPMPDCTVGVSLAVYVFWNK